MDEGAGATDDPFVAPSGRSADERPRRPPEMLDKRAKQDSFSGRPEGGAGVHPFEKTAKP